MSVPNKPLEDIRGAIPQERASVSRLDETFVPSVDPAEILEKGLAKCRAGEWKEGFDLLSSLAAGQKEAGQMPARYYSYLGYGMALHEKRYDEGIKLCRFAIKKEFYETENYVNLARTCLLAGKRRMAWKAVEKGLRIDAKNKDLQDLHSALGKRRPPVLSFLGRGHILNRILGSVRNSVRPMPKIPEDEVLQAKTKSKPRDIGGRKHGTVG